MGDGGIGLIVGVGADTSGAEAVFPRFEAAAAEATASAASGMKGLTAAAGQSGAAITEIAGRANPSLLSARESARLLSEELGVHLPRGVTSAISRMVPAIGTLGTALLAVFAVEEIPKLIHAIGSAAEYVAGYTEAVKKAYEADVKANQAAVVHFSSVAQAQRSLAETTHALGIVAHVTWSEQVVKGTQEAYKETSAFWGPLQGVIALYSGIGNAAATAADEQVHLLAELREKSLGTIRVMKEETEHELKMFDLGERGATIGKQRSEQISIELGLLEQKRKLELDIAREETGEKVLKQGGDFMAELHRREAEVNAEIDLQRKLLLQGAGAMRETTDRLAELLAKERDQAEALEIGNNKERQLLKAYQDEVRAIDAAVAAAGKKGLSDKQEQEAIDAKAQALRNYHTALALLPPVFPPIVAEMQKIEESLFAEKIHEQALAILGLDDAAKKVKLSLPEYATMLKLEGGALTQVTRRTQQLTAAQRAALPTDQEIKKVNEDLLKIWPNMTEQERKLMAAHLATAAAVHKATTETGNRALVTRDLTKAILEELVAEGKLTEAEAKSMAAANGVVLGANRAGLSLQNLKQDFAGVADATLQAGIAAAIYGKNVGQAMAQAAKATLASIAGEMGVEALKSAAYGVFYLAKYIASYGTDAAALAASESYFVSAAEFGAIAGAAGGAAAAIPGGGAGAAGTASAAGAGRGYGASGPAGAASQPMGPTSAGALPAQVGQGPGITSFGGGGAAPSGTLHVMVLGESSGAQYVARVLNNYTQRQGGQLVASRAIAPPRAGR